MNREARFILKKPPPVPIFFIFTSDIPIILYYIIYLCNLYVNMSIYLFIGKYRVK
jgi:hypothetical protein